MDRLYEILEDIRPDVDFRNIKSLVTSSYIDSFDIVTIISYIEDEYSIGIPVEEMRAKNFDSAEAIMEMISEIKGCALGV